MKNIDKYKYEGFIVGSIKQFNAIFINVFCVKKFVKEIYSLSKKIESSRKKKMNLLTLV